MEFSARLKKAFKWLIIVVLVVLIFVQGVFLGHYQLPGWQAFCLAFAYAPAVFLLLWGQWKETKAASQENDAAANTNPTGDRMTFAALKNSVPGVESYKMYTWLLFVIPLAIQLSQILITFTEKQDKDSFFGPRFLKFTLSLPAAVFLLLDTMECMPRPELDVEWSEVLDLVDTVEFLEPLLIETASISPHIKNTIVAFACGSFLLPAFSLWELQALKNTRQAQFPNERIVCKACRVELQAKKTGDARFSKERLASKVYRVAFVNLPFLVVRVVLFFKYDLDASIFAAKNIFSMFVCAIEIISACRAKSEETSNQTDTTPDRVIPPKQLQLGEFRHTTVPTEDICRVEV